MDDDRFDGLIQRLGSGTTRRGALGVLAGIAGLGLSEVAAKRRHLSGAQRGKGRSGGRGHAAAADKVAVCHFDADADAYVSINISRRGWENGHQKNHENDFLRGGGEDEVGCCTDSECSELSNQCNTGVCDSETGTCTPEPANEGDACGSDPCVEGQICSGGQCAGGSPKSCPINQTCQGGDCVCPSEGFILVNGACFRDVGGNPGVCNSIPGCAGGAGNITGPFVCVAPGIAGTCDANTPCPFGESACRQNVGQCRLPC